MATMITNECINCGACESECPNTAIYQGGVEWELNGVKHPPLAMDVFYIVPEKCTECVGFHNQEACAVVCPADVCVPNPDIPETEEQLIVRAKQLHAGEELGSDYPSHFRAAGGGGAAAEQKVPAQAGDPPAAAPSAGAGGANGGEPELGLILPDIGDWEIPIDCRACGGPYTVSSQHLRAGVVLRCPVCSASYVVTTTMHGSVSRALREFHGRWTEDFESFQQWRRREIEEFEARQRAQIEAFNDSLKRMSQEIQPPGAPHKRAWIFG